MRLKVGMNGLSVRALCLLVGAGMLLSMLAMSAAFGIAAGDARLFWAGGALTLCGLAWLWALTRLFGRRLSRFAGDLCRILDDMMDGGEAPRDAADSETLFARIYGRLIRLYGVLQRSRLRVDAERRELQALISDISHQVKTPVSNLRMIVDTLLARPVAERERTDFLQGLRSQTDKLDFLLQALVKTSRLETGAIRLEKREGNLYQTLAQAMSGIVYGAEKKGIAVGVDCPEELRLFHDAKWTAEALFNLLDNAVKYTPAGGQDRRARGTLGDVRQGGCARHGQGHRRIEPGRRLPALLSGGGGARRAGRRNRPLPRTRDHCEAGRLHSGKLCAREGFYVFRVPSQAVERAAVCRESGGRPLFFQMSAGCNHSAPVFRALFLRLGHFRDICALQWPHQRADSPEGSIWEHAYFTDG